MTSEVDNLPKMLDLICMIIYVLLTSLEKAMASHSNTLAWKIPWMEEPGRGSLWGREELDTTELISFQFSLSCIGEGNGNQLQFLAWRIPGTREPGDLKLVIYLLIYF